MSDVDPLLLKKDHEKARHATLTAKRRENRMKNLNITYSKSRKRRKTINNNSKSSLDADISLEQGRSSPIVEKVVYHCPYCSFWHQTLDGFHSHLTRNHRQGDQTYQCTYCHLTANSRRDIWTHIHRLSKTDSFHKRATCLVLSENLIERYAAYLKTVQVPSSAKCGQSSQNSTDVNPPSDIVFTELPKNMELTPDSGSSQSFEVVEDPLTFEESPISTFSDITIPLADYGLSDSPSEQPVKVQATVDIESIEPTPKKRRIDENVKNDLRISNKSHVDGNLNNLPGISRSSKQADSESDKDTSQPKSNVRKISNQRPNKNGYQAGGLSVSSDSDLANDDSDVDSWAPASSSSSEYSDWTTETGVNLEPPRFTRANMSKHGYRRDPITKPFRPCPMSFSLIPRKLPFYPQMGDEVIYFRQGHELYLDAVKRKKLYKFNPRSLPWYNKTINEQEFVKIIGIKYEIKPPMIYCLKLGVIDPATRALTGKSFIVKFHDIEGVLDFLVLQQDYYSAIQHTWKPGDCFRSIVNNARGVQMWWEGLIEQREPLCNQYPDSPFLCYRIRWKNNEVDRASPWDLEKINPDRRPTKAGVGIVTLPHEIASLLYKPLAEEWPPIGDRDAECDRISAGFSKVMDMYVAKHFLMPVNLELYPTYASVVKYPMDLSTIKARLDSRFYRRVSAVQYDVRRIYINAFKFNLPTSDIVRNSSVVSDLCLEIIRNRDSNDVKALYQQVLEKYRIRDEKEEKAAELIRNTEKKISDDAKPKKSRPSNVATAAAQCWKQQCKDLLQMLEQSEDAELFSELAKVQDEPDYLQVMDYPMDLVTVHEELKLSNYATPMDLARDVRVIFENSKSYFTNKKSRNWCMTKRLSDMFEEHISKIVTSFAQLEKSDQSMSTTEEKLKKGKTWIPLTSTHDSLQEFENNRGNNKSSSRHVNKDKAIVRASSSTQMEDANEEISVCSASIVASAHGTDELVTKLPDSDLGGGNLRKSKTPLLIEKEQLSVDIENGYCKLEAIEADLQKHARLLLEQDEQINAHFATLLKQDEEKDKKDVKTTNILKLTALTTHRDKIKGQLILCTKKRLTQELAWRERQATALKLELQLNSLDPSENALEFRTVEKMLAEKRNHEVQSEGELNSTKDEVVSLERQLKDVDRQILELKAMYDKLTEMEATKTVLRNQILDKKFKKTKMVEDLSNRINAWKMLEMKLVQILYEEAIDDIEKLAKQKFNKMNELLEVSPKP